MFTVVLPSLDECVENQYAVTDAVTVAVWNAMPRDVRAVLGPDGLRQAIEAARRRADERSSK